MADPRLFRLRVTFHETGRLAMLSHLELARALERAVRRAQLPFAVSQGFFAVIAPGRLSGWEAPPRHALFRLRGGPAGTVAGGEPLPICILRRRAISRARDAAAVAGHRTTRPPRRPRRPSPSSQEEGEDACAVRRPRPVSRTEPRCAFFWVASPRDPCAPTPGASLSARPSPGRPRVRGVADLFLPSPSAPRATLPRGRPVM